MFFLKKCLFKGAGVALITPMFADGSVNYDKLRELARWHVENGTDALVVCGTTGESATLSFDEHAKIISEVVSEVSGKICIIAGTGSNNTGHAIELSKQAQNLGVDGLLVVTPYYNKASQEGLVAHYGAIADSVSLPIIVYEVPSRTGCSFEVETLKKLSRFENIVAIKAASGNLSQVACFAAECGNSLAIYSGNDDQIVPVLALGGVGVISVLSNVLPMQTHKICELFFNGEVEKSRNLQLELLDLINCLFIDVNPIPVKDAMNLMGMDVGNCRLPLCSLNEAKTEILKKCLKKHGLI